MADVVTLLGEAGDGTGGTTIPCMVQKSVYDANSPSDFYDTVDGGPLSAGTGNLVALAGEFTLDFADTSDFLDGMYCWLDAASGNDAGWYEIVEIFPDDHITCSSTALDGVNTVGFADAAAPYSIGGLGELVASDTGELQALLDLLGTYAATGIHNVDILCHFSDPAVLTAILDIDNITGSSSTRVRTISCDSDFARSDGAFVIETATAITAMLKFGASSKYTEWYGIEINCKNGAAGATNGIYNEVDGSDYNTFENCEIHNASFANVSVRGRNPWYFYNCDVHDSDDWGYFTVSGNRGIYHIRGGKIRDNGLDGIATNVDETQIIGTQIYNNGTYGVSLMSTSSRYLVLINCTIYNNGTSGTGSGVKLFGNTPIPGHVIYNNTFTDNDDYGIEFVNDNPYTCAYLDYNHFDGNGIAEDDLTGSRQSMNDISGDPGFVSETPGEVGFLRPGETSILNDAGVGGTGDTIGAKCATAGGGGGSVNLLQGLLT